MSATLGELIHLMKERIKELVEFMPSAEGRRRMASDPNLSLPQLHVMTLTNPEEVANNAVLPLLALEDPAGLVQLQARLAFIRWVFSFYGEHYMGIKEETPRDVPVAPTTPRTQARPRGSLPQQ